MKVLTDSRKKEKGIEKTLRRYDDTACELRKRKYSIRKIAEELDIPTVRVYEALKRTGVDEEVYPDE